MKLRTQALVFDAYGTLFDVHSVIALCDRKFPGLEFVANKPRHENCMGGWGSNWLKHVARARMDSGEKQVWAKGSLDAPNEPLCLFLDARRYVEED